MSDFVNLNIRISDIQIYKIISILSTLSAIFKKNTINQVIPTL